jgi:ribonuclease P protein component
MATPRATPSAAPLGFPASRRVLRKADFDTAFRQGRRLGDPLLSLVLRPNGLGHPRLGVALAAKTVGNAVARNRLRRIIRDSFRLAQARLPAADLIIGARAGVRTAPAPQIRASLETLWNKAVHACPPPAP